MRDLFILSCVDEENKEQWGIMQAQGKDLPTVNLADL